MPIEAKKQERETSQSLARRFSRKVKMSGVLMMARKIRFIERKKSDQMKKKSALRREELKKEYEKKEKMGKLSKKPWKR